VTWEWALIVCVVIVCGCALAAWWMKLVHDQEPIDEDQLPEG
jgi:hypothetical protein